MDRGKEASWPVGRRKREGASMKAIKFTALTTVAGLILLAASGARADLLSIDFENPYTTGSINGQDGWSATGAYDYGVVATSSFGSPAGFAAQAFRISNAITSGSFTDWAFSKSLTDEAGEPGAANGGFSGGTRQPHYEVSFDIAAADPNEQPGLQISVSPDRGDGARMSFLKFRDTPTGLAVDFVDYRDNPPYGTSSNLAAGCGAEDDFVLTTIASGLSRSVPHHVKLVMDFVPGPRNDVVRVFVDGNVVTHCGTSWEDYFRYCEATDTSRTVDSLLLQARTVNGTAPGTLGKGFLVDNLDLLSGPLTTPPEVCPAVTAACAASACDTPNCHVNDSTGSDVSGCCASGTCKTIQFAVGDAQVGDVIAVAAGTYPEAAGGPLTISKTVTLCGAQAGVDARTRAGSETHITDPQGMIVAADDVVIDGFTIENATSGYVGMGLDMAQGTTGTQVYNNIVQNNVLGIGLANTGVSQVRICQNLIQNNNQPGSATGTGIYTDQYVCGNNLGVRPCSDFLIDDNAFKGNDTAGIDISDDDPTYGVTNIEVSTNTFDNNGRGVMLFNADSVSIHNNDITNSTTVGSGAIRLQGGEDGVTITNNNLDGGKGWAIRLTNAAGLGPSSNIVINENNIANFDGDGVGPNPGGLEVTANSYDGTLDATCNWWDDPCGPYNVQHNATGPGEEVRDPNDNVTFISWLIAAGPAPVSGNGTCTGTMCAVLPTTTTTSTTGSSTTSTTFPCTEPPETACSDMQDNDCDGKVDCADPDCNGISPCPRIRKDPSQVRFGPPGGLDVFQSHGKVDMPQVDLSKLTVGWLLSKSTGVIYRGRLNPGDLVASPRGTSFRFTDRAARSGAGSRNGIYFAKIKKVKDTGFAYSMRAYGDFSAATDAAMSIQFYAGERVFITSDTWTQIPTGWRAPKDH
jgi:parallel beta helix pectate lyase-like protein